MVGRNSVVDFADKISEDLENLEAGPNLDCIRTLLKEEPNNNNQSGVVAALKRFVSVDVLCASNAYECEKCCAPQNKKVSPRSGRSDWLSTRTDRARRSSPSSAT